METQRALGTDFDQTRDVVAMAGLVFELREHQMVMMHWVADDLCEAVAGETRANVAQAV